MQTCLGGGAHAWRCTGGGPRPPPPSPRLLLPLLTPVWGLGDELQQHRHSVVVQGRNDGASAARKADSRRRKRRLIRESEDAGLSAGWWEVRVGALHKVQRAH